MISSAPVSEALRLLCLQKSGTGVLAFGGIFFGVGKLPKVLGEMGKGVKAFKDGVNEGKSASEIEINATTEVVSEAEEVRTGA